MKIYLSPRAQELMDDPLTGPFLKPAVDELIRQGLDALKEEHNPLLSASSGMLRWEDNCPLVVYYNKEGDYALICEKPLYADFPRTRMPYYESLVPLSREMTVV